MARRQKIRAGLSAKSSRGVQSKRKRSGAPPKRPSDRSSAAASKTHVSVPGSRRSIAAGAKRLRDADPKSEFEVTITLRGPKLPDADHVAVQTISAKDFASNFAASQADADKVAQVLRPFGLKVEEVSLTTRSMRVSGTVAAMEAAFHPNLGIYESAEQGTFRDRQADYQIPKELKGIVTAVLGLGQRQVARRRSGASLKKKAGLPLAPLTPADLEQRYSFPPGDAKDQKIAIAEFGGGYFSSDVAAYCTKFGRATPVVNAISVNAPAYTLQQIRQLPSPQRSDELDASIEVMMDVEIIAGLCPAAQISVYFATFDQKGWVDLLNRVILDKPVALSISWGLAEDDTSWSPAARTAINQALNAAAALGITVCVASGDDGSGDQETDGRAHVDFPASSPFVLSVGGTMITGSAANTNEQVWWESPGRRTQSGGGATGGGVSVFFPRPQWQNVKVASLNGGSIDGRIMPDVAALAGPPLYDLVFLGGDAPNGGTSASAPLWAALIARIDAILPASKRQRFLTPLLYQTVSGGKPLGRTTSHDITVGNNGSHPKPGVGYKARMGYDAVTGWGTPIGTALLAGL